MTLLELAINRINLIIECGGIGVSDEVDNASEQLIKILINLTKNFKFGLSNEKRMTLDSFTFEAFNKKIKIMPTLCCYQDIQEFKNDGNRRGGWIEPYKWLMIDIPIINGKVYDITRRKPTALAVG